MKDPMGEQIILEVASLVDRGECNSFHGGVVGGWGMGEWHLEKLAGPSQISHYLCSVEILVD